MKCSCHMALTSPSLVNSLSLLFTIPTFFGPSFHDLLAGSYTLFTWPCCPASSDSRATLVIQSLLSFLRLFITSLPFSLYSLLALFFNLSDLAPSVVFFSVLRSSIFLQRSVLIQPLKNLFSFCAPVRSVPFHCRRS